MKNKLFLLFSLLLFNGACIHGQSGSMVSILEALSNVDVIVKNKRLCKKIKKDMKAIQKRGSLDSQNFHELQVAYENLRFVYNEEYLSVMKMDLSDYQNFNLLIKDPSMAATKYMQNYSGVADRYNEEFLPVLQNILYKDQENADIITVVKFGFKIFRKIVSIIKERKLEKSDLLQIGISEANEFLFKKLQLPEWDTYGITMSDGYGGSEEYPADPTNINPPAEMEIPQNVPASEGTYIPPISTATIPSISGQFHFEVYEENSGSNVPMDFQIGPTTIIKVPDFGEGNISADLIVGKPGMKRQSISHTLRAKKDHYVASFESSTFFSAETYYQIKTSTDGFTYMFAVNSGNKMYGFYPYQGGIENVPHGVGFTLPQNIQALRSADGSGNSFVTIPDEENYLMTHDINGIPPTVEILVVLFSRSELNLRDIFEQMEYMDENSSPQERLAEILGTQAATLEQGEVQLIGDTFSYRLTDEDPIVLPLVFAIKRQ